MINLHAAGTITPADVTLPATVHVDITWVLEEAGSFRRAVADQAQ